MKFTKPKGSTADLREIEYISALHQTGATLRTDGTINSADIKKFLISRYGIVVSEEDVTETIMKGFGGGGISEADGDTMDLTEMVAMLLIPTLVRTRRGMEERKLSNNNGGEYGLGHGSVVNQSAKTVDYSGVAHDNITDESFVIRNDDPSNKKKLFRYVLQMILSDSGHSTSSPPAITVDLLRDIFLFYGEKEVAVDTELLKGMVEVAKDAGDNLNEDVFAYCCTSDVELYDTEWENSLTSTYVDTFETFGSTKKAESRASKLSGLFKRESNDVESSEPREGGEVHKDTNDIMKCWTFPSVDYAVDTFRSKTYVLLLWFTWVLFYMNFIGGTNPEVGNLQCSQHAITTAKGFWCGVGQGVINWIKIMFKLVFLGSVFVIGASIGHSTTPHHAAIPLISVVFVSLYTFIPLTHEVKVLPSSDGYSAELNTEQSYDDYNIFLYCAQMSVGSMMLLFCLQNILDRSLPKSFLDKHPVLQQVLASGSLFMERNVKKAATFKVNRLISNALEIHDSAAQESDNSVNETMYGKALLGYSKISDEKEEVGGHLWTWNGLRTGRLFEEEGIWMSNRVMQGNLGQLFLMVLVIPMTIYLTEWVRIFYEITFPLLELPLPAEWRIILPIFVGFFFAELNCLGLVTVYIPSTIRTTFLFRYGGIGSLHDGDFQKMRTAVDASTFIFGSMFWGCFLSNTMVLAFAWLLATIFCVPAFLPPLLSLISTIIGLSITILIKMLLLMTVRSKFSGNTFYRSSPAVANFICVILEAWNLGISVLFVFVRMVKLLIAAFLYVARVDIPFLSDSADEVGGFVIDGSPFIFRKDLLQHEAHRHPYLERIGVMYMMKLRYGDRFGNESGTSWRLLFVYALLPWLRKYRIGGDGADEIVHSLKSSRHLTNNESDNAEVQKHEMSKVKESSVEVKALEKEVKRLKSEIKHLTLCLQEAKTEAEL